MSTRRPWTWPWLIATAAARGVLAVLIGLALWGAAPALFGWHPTTVSSGSMLPRLDVGDVAVSRPLGAQPPTIGSVLLFPDPDHPDRLRLHRFVGIDTNGLLVTRGDANPDNDSTPVDPGVVIGVGTLRIPYLGLPVIWWREGSWVSLGLLVAALAGLGALASQARRFTFDPPSDSTEDDPPGTPPEDPSADAVPVAHVDQVTGASGPDAPRRVLRLAAVAATVTAVLATVAVPSWSAFADTTTSRADLGANPYFSCANGITAIRPNVLLWYRLDETSSTATSATDSSGNARTGAYYGSVLTSPKTAVADRSCAPAADTGRAMTFNGSTGYLSSPQISGAAPNTFSVSIRFKTTTVRGGRLLGYGNVRTGLSNNYDRHLYLTNGGRVIFGVFPNDYRTVQSDEGLNDGKWHQVVGTLSSAGQRLYVDGELVDSRADTTTGQVLTGGYWRIAYDNLDTWVDQPSSFFFGGTLDDAVVYTTALTDAQVKAQWVASQPL